MEASLQHISPKEMLERIAELDFSHSHLRDSNDQMRLWLDSADEEMNVLRSENLSLRKQVKTLEQMIRDAQQDDAEACRSPAMDDTDVNRRHKERIQKLKKDFNEMKEENEKLAEEVRTLQEQESQNKITLSQLTVAFNTVELGRVESQAEVQHRDELIEQTKSHLMEAEVTVTECFNIIEDLREKNQQLRLQLEEKQEEISLAHFSDIMSESEGPKSSPLSFAEEIKLLLSTTPGNQEELQTEAILEFHPEPVPESTERCKPPVAKKEGLHVWWTFFLVVSGLLILLLGPGMSSSMKTLWNRTQMLLHPYCSLYHHVLPPI